MQPNWSLARDPDTSASKNPARRAVCEKKHKARRHKEDFYSEAGDESVPSG